MNLRPFTFLSAGLFALLVAASASAVLVERGAGLIYDTDLDITWLADFKYAQTSGFDPDGLMTWHTAMSWAAGLAYSDPERGTTWTDWRLPTALNPDSSGPCFGFSCPASEMGHLFLVDGVAPSSPRSFVNFTSGYYWSGTGRAPFPGVAWLFYFAAAGTGKQDFTGPFEDLLVAFAGAVRDGDVAATVCASVDCSGAGTACATASCNPNGAPDNCDILAPLAAGTECRVSTGVCDVAEQCTGSSAACPADGANLTSVCRASASICDAAEFCSDASDDCPADAFEPATTSCRVDAGDCDVEEFCDGTGACPTDGFEPSTTPCDDGVACTESETCDGMGICDPGIPNDALCDDALFCTGVEACDLLADCQAGTPPTGDDGVVCTNEICDENLGMIVSVPHDANCDDGDACTTDMCDSVAGCGHAFIPNCVPIDVPAASLEGRGLLSVLLLFAGVIFSTRRRSRVS
jgi:hypothetical protein